MISMHAEMRWNDCGIGQNRATGPLPDDPVPPVAGFRAHLSERDWGNTEVGSHLLKSPPLSLPGSRLLKTPPLCLPGSFSTGNGLRGVTGLRNQADVGDARKGRWGRRRRRGGEARAGPVPSSMRSISREAVHTYASPAPRLGPFLNLLRVPRHVGAVRVLPFTGVAKTRS